MTTRTNPSVLLVAAVATGLVVNLLLGLVYADLPTFPVLAGATLLVLGIAEVVLGFVLRARIQRRRGARPVDALATARAVALAKASSLGGSIVGGAWLGILAYVAPRAGDFAAAGSDTVSSVVGAVGAVVLVGAGLWLEYCCRTPDDDHRRDPSSSRPPHDGSDGHRR